MQEGGKQEDQPYLHPRQLDVMKALWSLGSGTVAEVRALLEDELAYTTVLTTLQKLVAKGFVRYVSEGRGYRYFPVLSIDRVRATVVGQIRDVLFGGSSEQMCVALLTHQRLDEDTLQRLKAVLANRQR